MILFILYYLLFSAVFYLIYRLSYARLSFHRINRVALLILPLLAISIAYLAPQFQIPIFRESMASWQLPEIIIEGQSLSVAAASSNEFPDYWSTIYLMGLVLSALYFLIGLGRLRKLIRQSQSAPDAPFKLYYSKYLDSAFCFAHYIFLPLKLKNQPEEALIIEHERRHILLGHVWDRLYYKLLGTLLWFDPFIHAFARELRQIHEFEVDADLLKQENIERYAQTLLSSTLGADLNFPEKALAPSPFFNSSLIKSRITMMYANQSRPWRKALYAFLIPITLAMTVLACNKSESDINATSPSAESNSSVSMAEVEDLPLTGACQSGSELKERQKCLFQAISSHIGANFKYPPLAKAEGMEGRIFLSFVVQTDGSIGEVSILKSLDAQNEAQKTARDQAEAQAKALIASLPKFERPAFKNGKPVPMKLTVPIKLELS